jgi:replicative DNA helicase
MTLEFQKELFRFVLQDKKEGSKHIKLLDPSIFSQSEYQVLFDLAQKYFEKYKVLPSKTSFLEFFDKSSKTLDLEKRILDRLDKSIRELYVPFNLDLGIVKETIIEFAQYQKTKELFTKYASKLSEGQSTFKEIQKEMNKIMSIGAQELASAVVHGGSLLEEDPPNLIQTVHPCYIHGVNRLTAAGGFHSPQLIVLMAPPKGFKTGNLLKMAIEYAKSGLKCYYVDLENGVGSIRQRAKQAFLECTREELYETEIRKTYRELRGRIKLFGGDLITDYYPSYSKTVLDVESELEKLRDEKGWIPDAIFWDYPDLLEPTDRNIKEKRLKPTAVYSDIIKLNVRWGTFSMALSQVNRAALDKEVFTMQDFAEDFGKAATAHAAFALCATEVEQMGHLQRWVPVMQREGQRYLGHNFAITEVMEDVMSVREVSIEYADKKLKELPQPQPKVKGKKRRHYPDKDVDDN